MKFIHAIKLALAGGLVLAQLAGCGGGGGGSASTTLSGSAMAGPFLSGQACAYGVKAGAKDALLGKCVALANSAFSIDLGGYAGDVLVEIGAGAAYDDEADPSDGAAGTSLSGTLRTLIHVGAPGGTVDAVVSPLTELALRMAGAQLDDSRVQAALAQLKAMLPTVAGLDLRATPPSAAADRGLAYLELLRALSQMQWQAGGNAAYNGGLNAYLGYLVGQFGASGNTFAADFLAQLASGLDSRCTVNNGVLACQAAGGGSGSPTCLSAHYQAGAVHQPSAAELAPYLRSYTGNTGSFGSNGFVSDGGSAAFVIGSGGALTYNGSAQTVNSVCIDNSLPMIYVEFGGTGAVDFFSTGEFTGNLPDLTAVYGAAGGGSGGSGNTATGLSMPNGKVVSAAAGVSYQSMPNIPNGKIITYQEGTAKVEVYDYVDTLGVAVTDTGMSIGIAPANGCALNPAWVNPNAPACADVGIAFDRAAGKISFSHTPMHAVVFACPGDCSVDGSLAFAPY